MGRLVSDLLVVTLAQSGEGKPAPAGFEWISRDMGSRVSYSLDIDVLLYASNADGPDAHLAAVLRQHGVRRLWSLDRDFRKFSSPAARRAPRAARRRPHDFRVRYGRVDGEL